MHVIYVANAAIGPSAGVIDKACRVELPDDSNPPVWYDCDTEEDLRRAEEWTHGR